MSNTDQSTTLQPPREWLASILHCIPGDLEGSSSILTHAAWDSFAQVEIMLYIEATYNVKMTAETIRQYTSVEAIESLHQQVAEERG